MKLQAASRLAASYHADERGTYASVVPTRAVRNTLHELINRYVKDGDRTGLWDLHSTVVWSKSSIGEPQQHTLSREYSVETRFTAKPLEVVVWAGHDNENYLVLLLDSPDLVHANQRMLELGLPPANFDYKPHLTLAKRVSPDFNTSDLNMAIRTLSTITFSGFRLEDAKT